MGQLTNLAGHILEFEQRPTDQNHVEAFGGQLMVEKKCVKRWGRKKRCRPNFVEIYLFDVSSAQAISGARDNWNGNVQTTMVVGSYGCVEFPPVKTRPEHNSESLTSFCGPALVIRAAFHSPFTVSSVTVAVVVVAAIRKWNRLSRLSVQDKLSILFLQMLRLRQKGHFFSFETCGHFFTKD